MSDEYSRARDALTRVAYRALLKREPDAAAAAALSALPFSDDQEAELAAILTKFIASDEFRQRYYVEFTPPPRTPRPAAFAALAHDLDSLRAGIERLQRELPDSLSFLADSLDSYDAYYDRWLRNAEPPLLEDRRVAVLVDAMAVDTVWIHDFLWSLAEQSHQSFSATIVIEKPGLAVLQDLMRQVRRVSDIRMDYVLAEDAPDWPASFDPGEAEVVVACRADCVLHPHALRWLDGTLAASRDTAAVYSDDDELGGDASVDWRLRPHVAPRLKPAFDEDLLLQTPYVGDLVAFTRDAWSAGATPARSRDARRLHAPWRVLGLGRRCQHIPMILCSRQTNANTGDGGWRALVAERLEDAADVAPHANALGPSLDSACRVRWRPATPSPSVVVVIPTKDRLDLLEPCVESALASLEHNAARVRLEIIDHDSREKSTRSYLKRLARRDDVTVRPFSGAFNWALMNNLAAHEATEDVLVFLNNDTEVIAADWLDELVGQAMRPDVGVVGARLVYGDGHVQHAGFLALDHPDRFLTHDGLEAPGDSPGYLGRNILVHRTVAVTGACMAVRRDVFTRLGGFDSARFHVEGNDVDLCFKAAAAGLKVLYTPYAVLRHFESRTRSIDSAEAREMSREARRRLWNRWGRNVCPDPWYNPRFERRGRPFERLRPI